MTPGKNYIVCVIDTSDKLFTDVNETADKLFTSVNDTADKLFHWR
jgi:hypothetical protein